MKASWEAATRSPVLFGTSFYARLFWVMPEARSLFGPDVAAQERKLTETLDVIVAHAGRLGAITKELRDLAHRHVAYGVRPEHYDVVGEVLMWTLEHSLGPRFTADQKRAWEETYAALADVIVASAYGSDANEARGQP